jgi:uncharacterized membrane protein YkoI
MMDRRLFLLALMGLFTAGLVPAGPALAKDGGDDDGGDDDSDGGSDSGGSGSDDSDDSDDDDDDNSGRGGGGDDGRDSDDDDKNDSRSGRSGRERDHQKAREAVDQGRILPLRDILRRVDDLGGGRVIGVDLNLKARAPYYTLKVQSGSRVRTMKFEAATGRKLNIFGW